MDNIKMTDAQLRKLIDGLADGLVTRIYGVAKAKFVENADHNGTDCLAAH